MAILSLILIAQFVLGFVAGAGILWLGGRTVGAPKATFGRATLVFCAAIVLAIIAVLISLSLQTSFGPAPVLLFVEVVLGLAQIVILWNIIRVAFDTTLGRAVLVWLMSAVSSVVVTVGCVFALKAFVLNAYTIPTNAMAPTIVGWHRTMACPNCRETLIVPAMAPDDRVFRPEPGELREVSICSACRKMYTVAAPKSPVNVGDRILVSRLAKLQRWDMVVFRPPEPEGRPRGDEPTPRWVMRLVGLPGEKVMINDGAIWINDAKLDLPAELAGTVYVNNDEFIQHAHPDGPLQLGPSQYCVLGDFSSRSNDSRFWGPLPGENIEAVVVACYWPSGRWRVFRW